MFDSEKDGSQELVFICVDGTLDCDRVQGPMAGSVTLLLDILILDVMN